MTAVDHAELKRVEGEGKSPVYTAAYDTIRKGAPGLSDATCSVLAVSINMKVAIKVTAPLLSEIEGLKAERDGWVKWADEKICESQAETLDALRTQAPDSWRPDREAVARTIAAASGVSWDDHVVTYSAEPGPEDQGPTERYYRAADAILALRPQTAES